MILLGSSPSGKWSWWEVNLVKSSPWGIDPDGGVVLVGSDAGGE